MSPATQVFLAALVTAIATGLGALPFVFVRSMSPRVVAYAYALAGGLMLGACFGLIAEGSKFGATQTVVGGLIGVVGILFAQWRLKDRPIVFGGADVASARQMVLLLAVMTAHSFSEGVAVGVSFGGSEALALAITVAIAVHNIPEGLAISAVMRSKGQPVLACAGWSVFSSLPQPLMAVPAYLLVDWARPVLPYGLGFAAGAMAFMVLDELLPEAYVGGNNATVALLTSVAIIGMVLFQHSL
jgi:zinc transporter ZupT